MHTLFSKKHFVALLALLSISHLHPNLEAYDEYYEAPESRLYIGGFGGELFSNSSKMYQMGTAFFTEAEGGPLAVYARGRSNKTQTGFGGVQIGYEPAQQNCCSTWGITPAFEIEALFYSHNKKGDLINDTDRIPEHDFVNSFKLNMNVCLVNAILKMDSFCLWGLTPYVGGGIGAAHISLKNANSLQIDPPEPGINHYNSKRNDTSWAFAAQAKAGLSYRISQCFHVFAEYRYLFVDSSNYILGSTVYPNHAATSPWNVKIDNLQYNAFVLGLQYDL